MLKNIPMKTIANNYIVLLMNKLPFNTKINIGLHFPIVLPCLIAMLCANAQVGG